ncbi:MAG: hypothetical protein WBP45_04820, partial [Daejeonella sp.]
GEVKVKEGEELSFKFIEIDKANPSIKREIENVKWIRSADAAHSVNGKEYKMKVQISDVLHIEYKDPVNKKDIAFVLYFVVEKPDTLAESKIEELDVSNVSNDIWIARKKIFINAMAQIKTKNPELYAFAHAIPTQVKLVYNTYPKMADQIKEVGGDKDPNKQLYGFANANIDYHFISQLSLESIIKEGDIIKDATILGKFTKEENEQIKLAVTQKRMTDKTEEIYIAVQYYKQSMADSLKQMIISGKLDAIFLERLRFGIGANNISKFLTFDIKNPKQMDILLNENIVGSSPTDFKRTLAHEIGHLYFAYNNKLEKLKWYVIRELKAKYNYQLGDEVGANGHCSGGSGHEKYNPENASVCNTESNY